MLTSVKCSTKANTLNYFNIHPFKLLNFLIGKHIKIYSAEY